MVHIVCGILNGILKHLTEHCMVTRKTKLRRFYFILCLHAFLLVRPEAIACGADLSFSPDVFFYFFAEREISEMRGLTGVKFCTMVSTRPNFIMPVQNFGAHTPKKFQGPKTCKI